MDEVAPGVLVATSRRYATTSTAVLAGREVLLVDPAWEPDELAAIADDLDARGLHTTAGFATHAHHDHVLWHPRFGDVPRYASSRTAELAARHREELVANLRLTAEHPEHAALADLVGRVVALPGGTVPGPVDAQPVEHDGHAPGHTALWLDGPRVLLAGDMLSDIELPLPLDPDDLPAYLAGLDRLAPYVAAADVLVPGHGSPTSDPAARLAADRRYLDTLLAGGDPDDPRRALPGMAEVHERVRALAQPGSSASTRP